MKKLSEEDSLELSKDAKKEIAKAEKNIKAGKLWKLEDVEKEPGL